MRIRTRAPKQRKTRTFLFAGRRRVFEHQRLNGSFLFLLLGCGSGGSNRCLQSNTGQIRLRALFPRRFGSRESSQQPGVKTYGFIFLFHFPAGFHLQLPLRFPGGGLDTTRFRASRASRAARCGVHAHRIFINSAQDRGATRQEP